MWSRCLAVCCFCLFLQFFSVVSSIHQISSSFQSCFFIFEIRCEWRKQRSKCVPVRCNMPLGRRGSSKLLQTSKYWRSSSSGSFTNVSDSTWSKPESGLSPLKLTFSAVLPSSIITTPQKWMLFSHAQVILLISPCFWNSRSGPQNYCNSSTGGPTWNHQGPCLLAPHSCKLYPFLDPETRVFFQKHTVGSQ